MRSVVRKVLPSRAVSWLVLIKRQIKLSVTRLLSAKRWLANFWYGLIKCQFSREIFVTKKGQLKHHSLNRLQRPNHARLRRNTHRLEKGLLMRPRRDRFAQAYLPELVSDYTAQVRFEEACTEELQWAHNVLAEYFAVVKDDNLIAEQRSIFEGTEHRFNELKKYKPYARSDSPKDIPSWDSLNALSLRRRSVRWFKQQAVPRELLEQAIETASLSPSACNRQPFDIYVVDGQEQLNKIVHLPMGTKGWADNIPMFLVFVGDFSSFEHERDRHVPYIDSSLSAMSLMLALETLGLSSCPINWPDIEPREQKMAQLLKLKVWQRPIMCLAVGYADDDGHIAYSQKRTANQLIKYIQEN